MAALRTLLLRALVIISLTPALAFHPRWWEGRARDGDVFLVGPRLTSTCNADGELCSAGEVDVPGDVGLVGTLILLAGLLTFLAAAFLGIAGHTRYLERLRVRWIDAIQAINAVTLLSMLYFLGRLAMSVGGAPSTIALGAVAGTVAIMTIVQLGIRRWVRAEARR